MIWYTFGVLIHLGFLKYTKFSFWHTYSNPVSSSDFISSCVCATLTVKLSFAVSKVLRSMLM